LEELLGEETVDGLEVMKMVPRFNGLPEFEAVTA